MAKKKGRNGNGPQSLVEPIVGDGRLPLDEVDRTTIGFYIQRLALLKQEFDTVNQRLSILLTRIVQGMGKDPKDWQINATGAELVLRPKPQEKVEEKTNA